MNSRILEIAEKLIEIQSDPGTLQEINVAKAIFEIIREDEYFKCNPQFCGVYVGKDLLKRPVVWALKKGKSDKTVILTGHYDCVEIDCYGELKEYALKPSLLMEKLREIKLPSNVEEDLNSGKWLFGRGINDMKMGLAIELDRLFSYSDLEANVLFLAVSDEENLSAGMRDASKLLVELKDRFRLDYSLLVLTEPHMGEKTDEFKIYTGTVGKIMPAVVVKGQIAHASEVMAGLNSSYIMAEIVKNIELNYNLCSKFNGAATQPPTCLYFRDLKGLYDVSLPEYTGAYFNYQFLNDVTSKDILNKIKSLCEKGLKEAVSKYKDTFEQMCSKGDISSDKKREYEVEVLSFEELEKVAIEKNAEYKEYKESVIENIEKEVLSGGISLQEAGLKLIKKVIELSGINKPIAVVGFIPPYYPAVDDSLSVEKYVGIIENILKNKYNLIANTEPYFMGICDISYTKCENVADEEKVMENMLVTKDLYNSDFAEINGLNIPAIVVGPLGKDYHTMYERVYIDEAVNVVPSLIDEIVKNI